MSIEEVLRKNVPTITFDKLIGTPIAQVLSAMDEYAKLHAVDYGSFLVKYIKSRMEFWLKGIDAPIEENLYEQYLLHKQNKEQ